MLLEREGEPSPDEETEGDEIEIEEIEIEEVGEEPEVAPPTDWTQERVYAEQGLMAIVETMVDARLERLMKKVETQIAEAQNPSRPSLAMKAKVHDRFITPNTGDGGTWLKHYRCQTATSVKCDEYDLDLLEQYMSGEKERPEGKNGRPYSDGQILNICRKTGQTINWVDSHCYAYTESHIRNIERLKELAEKGLPGGMAGIYEDFGGVSWPCTVCPQHPVFQDKRTYVGHMTAVHGIPATQFA